MVDSDRCWLCNTGERQSRFHPRGQMPSMGRAGTSHVEKDLEVVLEERPIGPVGEGHVRGQQSDARGLDLFEGHEGGKDGFAGS